MQNNSEEVMNLLTKIRKYKEISQTELASKTGLTQQAVSAFESGSRKPTIDNFLKYLDGLNINLKELILKGVK